MSSTLCRPLFRSIAGLAPDWPCRLMIVAPFGNSLTTRLPWASPPQVIVAANDDMALGAMEAVKGRNLSGIAIIGFDALPEALAQVRDGGLTATIEQFPGKQCSLSVQILDAFLKTGKKPDQQVTLLTPVAITKDNLKEGERLSEVK